MRRVKAQKPWKQPGEGKTGQATDNNRIIRAPPITQINASIRNAPQPFCNDPGQRLSLAGRNGLARATGQQFLTQPFFQSFHMLADRTLADAKFFRRRTEVCVADHHLEGAQCGEGQVKNHIRQTNGVHKRNQMACGPRNRQIGPTTGDWVLAEITAVQGARNLLANCAKAQRGERLLIAYEPPEYGFFDHGAVGCVVTAAKELGLHVDTVDVGFTPNLPHLTRELLARIAAADIILFLARLGDQLRFSDMPPGKKIIVSFAVTQELFGSGFANGHHDAFTALKIRINTVLASAKNIHVTCAAGSDFSGRPAIDLGPKGDTSVLRFPMSVFTPVPAHSFSGRVALAGFLTGTGSRYYPNYTVEFEGPVAALFDNGQLTGFDGSAQDVRRADRHYDYVSDLFGIDRNFVHSWHAGIHPGCGYPWDMRQNMERWGGAAFGNPRILHFHTCGAYAPGEISWNMIDPTITIDGVSVWENGVLHIERLPGGREIIAPYPCACALFASPNPDIGFHHAVVAPSTRTL